MPVFDQTNTILLQKEKILSKLKDCALKCPISRNWQVKFHTHTSKHGKPTSDKFSDNYKRCYGKNKLKFGTKPVLIVIDCVKAYHDPNSPLYAPERFDIALKSIIRLIEKCRAVGIPVVYTSVIYETPSSGGKWYTEKLPNVLCCYDAGNPFRDFAEGAEPRKDEAVILKQYSSSFFGTSLSSLLASLGCDSTILCGYSTSGCVRATGRIPPG